MSLPRDYKDAYETFFRNVLATAAPGHYDESALPSYTHSNRLMSWLFWRRVETALRLAELKPGQAVLDFGCGGGVTFRRLEELGCHVTGCDNAAHALATDACARFGLRARVCSDLSELDGERFDLIFALDVLEHVDDLSGLISRLRTLSRPGTQLVLSGPTESALYKIGRRLAGFSGDYHVRNIYDIEAEMAQQGLRRTALRRLYPPAPCSA